MYFTEENLELWDMLDVAQQCSLSTGLYFEGKQRKPSCPCAQNEVGYIYLFEHLSTPIGCPWPVPVQAVPHKISKTTD